MADTAVESPAPVASRDEMEDVDMLDNNSAQFIPESGNGIPTDAPSETAPPIRKRPKLDLSGFTDPAGSTRKGPSSERKKGKSIFGVALGTLNKAKVEEKLRMSSEAAKKRQEIVTRLQAKLAREQDIVRKQDESRKDRISALRKQEDLSIKDSILKHRYSALPSLANFLLTSDVVPQDVDMDEDDDSYAKNVELAPKQSHPPTLYYLPKILTPSQEAFIARRRKRAEQRVAEEKEEWETERSKGMDEVRTLKETSEAARAQAGEAQRAVEDDRLGRDTDTPGVGQKQRTPSEAPRDRELSVAAADRPIANDAEPAAMEGVDDDAVEY